ncbi:MAG: VTT domain-containing protein [Acidobacteriaceae bacterium]
MIFAAKGKPRHLISPWLLHFGVFEVFGVALVDSSPIPLPVPGSTDILILILGAHGEMPWLLALAGVLGSVIGGYLTWKTGQKGGEAMLERYVSGRYQALVKRWVKGHGILTVALAALLPPPIPLLPFLLAAGALGVTRRQIVIALGTARSIRYGVEAALALVYGHRILHWANKYLAGWSNVILYTFLGLVAAGILFGIWKYKHDQHRAASPNHARVGAA